MNPTDIGDLTFEMLDQERGCALPPPPPNGEYPLPEGYRCVRKTWLKGPVVEDICRACRQGGCPEYVVLLPLRHLDVNPLTGEMYEGELIAALGSIEIRYWRSQAAFREQLDKVLRSARNSVEVDNREDIDTLLRPLDQARTE